MSAAVKRGATMLLNAMHNEDRRFFFLTEQAVGEPETAILIAATGEKEAGEIVRAFRRWIKRPGPPRGRSRGSR